MDQEEILNMPAGRDINALIHWLVFENKVKKVFWTDDPNLYYYSSDVDFKNYSEDIAAALEIIEKYTDAVIEKVGGHYCVNLMVASACAETAPLAICRAALLAVEVRNG